MSKGDKGNHKGPPPQKLLLAILEDQEAAGSNEGAQPVPFPYVHLNLQIPYLRAVEEGIKIVPYILVGHVTRYEEAEDGTEKPTVYETGILGLVTKMETAESVLNLIVELKSRVKLYNAHSEDSILFAEWEQITEEKPNREEFLSRTFQKELARLSPLAQPIIQQVERGELNAAKFDIRMATAETIGEFLDRYAYFVLNKFVKKSEKLLLGLRYLLSERNVAKRLGGLAELVEYMSKNPEIFAASSKQSPNASRNSYEERYNEIKSSLPEEARIEIEKELGLMKRGGYPGEISGAKNHLDCLLQLFALAETEDNTDVAQARAILDEDHWGLERVKEQILEFLAVRKNVPSGSGDILCFVGPPGIGKTSLGKSIARALGRKSTHLSLGGVYDVGEIRGHGLVYVRTHPGQIIQHIVKSGSRNPVFVLDEIDKIGEHWRGDPASALLEVLDPEQNNEFFDIFVNVPFDLSHVFFICTANNVETIPRPLRDRMEIILLPGYTQPEKLAIARKYLVAKQREKQGLPLQREGLDPLDVSLADDALKRLIEEYTREAGVRGVEREIRRIFRKVALRTAEGDFRDVAEIQITAQNLRLFAGKPRIYPEQRFDNMPVGCVPMFAVSDEGGHFFYVEVMMQRGRSRRKIKVTGVRGSGGSRQRINNLIEESFDVAFDCLMLEGGILHEPRGERKTKGEFYIHIHIRDGATPKDGPSAGIPAIVSAFSLLTQTSIQPHVGATGEIDLKLGILEPIGGLKEKALAAHRAGIKRFVIPKDNERDLEDVPAEIKPGITFIPCHSVWQALLEFFPNNEIINRFIEGKVEWSS